MAKNQATQLFQERKELTDEWKRIGVKEELEYASLTDIITREWSGFTTKQYKHFKGLKKENLRDNLTNLELLSISLPKPQPPFFPSNLTHVASVSRPNWQKTMAALQRRHAISWRTC